MFWGINLEPALGVQKYVPYCSLNSDFVVPGWHAETGTKEKDQLRSPVRLWA